MAVLNKLVVPVTDVGGDLFPFTRAVPKELLPMGDAPIIQRVVDEAVDCKIKEIIFVATSGKKNIIDHFKNLDKLPINTEDFKERYSDIQFSYITQKKSSNSGYIIYRAKEKTGEEPFAISFPDTLFYGKKSSFEQLFAIYRTSQKPVVALKRIGDEDFSEGYIVKTEKIASRFYKIKKIVESPKIEETDSRLALAGRYILTPGIFQYLKGPGSKISVVDALNELIMSGKTVYGHECEGQWFSLKNKEEYLEAQKFFLENKE